LKTLVAGLVAVVVGVVLVVAAQQGMFANTLGTGKQPPAPPANAIALVDQDVTFTHYASSDWTIGVRAAPQPINGSVAASAGSVEIRRSGDETPGKWFFDGAARLDDKNGAAVWTWTFDPSFVEVGYNGQSAWFVKYTPRTPYVTETGTYLYRVNVHIWFERASDHAKLAETQLSAFTNFVV
jgi:hypothetical protein